MPADRALGYLHRRKSEFNRARRLSVRALFFFFLIRCAIKLTRVTGDRRRVHARVGVRRRRGRWARSQGGCNFWTMCWLFFEGKWPRSRGLDVGLSPMAIGNTTGITLYKVVICF